MKTYDLLKFAMLFICISFFACSNKLNPGFKQGEYEPIILPEPVHTLNSMASGERVVLTEGSLTDILLSWTPTAKQGNTVYRYEILFDGPNGDFSKPIQVLTADNNGLDSKSTLTHYQVNMIGKMAGFKANTNGTLHWKVKAYCGLDESISTLEGYFVVFMMDGIDNVPSAKNAVFITGEGAEDGGNEDDALKMLFCNDGVYEIFTKISADEPFVFMTEIDNDKHYYYANINGKLRERQNEDDGCLISESGIYRIKIDFNSQSFTSELVGDVYLYNLSGKYRVDFAYLSNGKWGVKDYTARKQKEGWAGSGETRHSFNMDINNSTIRWGHKRRDESQPTATTDVTYYNLYEVPGGADSWDYSFRYCDDLLQWGSEQNGVFHATVKTDITLYFNAEHGTYTHRWMQSNTN